MSQNCGPLQSTLEGIFRRVLGLPDLDASTPLSDLDGLGVRAGEIVDAIRKETRLDLAPLDVLEAATIRNLCAAIPDRPSAMEDAPDTPTQPGRAVAPDDLRDGDAPASPGQEALWLLDQIEGGSAAYNLSTALQLRERFEPDLVEAALRGLVQRHEALRTRFVDRDGTLMQVVSPATELPWTRADLSDQPTTTLANELGRFARLPFELSEGPMIRARLYRVPGADAVLQIVVHHIVFDGWSKCLLLWELDAALAALSRRHSPEPSEPSEPGEPACRNRDYGAWQRRRFHGRLRSDSEAFWAERLAGLPLLLDLPLDRPRLPVRTSRGGLALRILPPPLVQRLERLSRDAGATLFMVALAGFKALLHRYTGQPDIAVGSPMAQRDEPEFEGLVGFLVNTVVLRTRVAGDASFRELLRDVRATALEAEAHRAMPFESVVEMLNPPRSLNHSPLFQVLFEYQGEFGSCPRGEPAAFSALYHETGTAKYDISMEISTGRDGLTCAVEYSADIFDRVSMERLLGHYETLLAAAAADLDTAIADLDLLSPSEADALLTACRGPAKAILPSCIHEAFLSRAAEAPSEVALRCEGRDWSFAEVDARSARLARRLGEAGIGVGQRVAVCLDRSPAMVVAVLGILRSGAAYVPIDPRFPAQRVAFILGDSAAALLITETRWRTSTLSGIDVPTFCVDADANGAHGEAAAGPPALVGQPGDCAYVIYTSGTTGAPKGVMVSHASAMNTLEALEELYPMARGDRFLLKTNYVFDVSVPELFGWFMGRGSLVILPAGQEGSPDLLIEYIAREAVTHVNFSPAMLGPVLAQIRNDPSFRGSHALKYVLVCGEAFPKDMVRHAVELLAPAAVHNLYGPTEAAIYATAYLCGGEIASINTPIGTPLPNTRTYVLDGRRKPVPVGITGELFIGGPGVAQGYLGKPGLTAERFVGSPFEPGRKLYRTGDLVRWLADGNIEYQGRNDFQVKIRGVRIEPGEIEARITSTGLASQAVVLAKTRDDGGRYLVAYVIPASGSATEADRSRAPAALVERLRQELPEQMVPSAVVALDRLPLTPSGKFDRSALVALAEGTPVAGGEPAAPRDHRERMLCGIWADVLRLDGIGIRDNFFAFGGDSILSIQVAARAKLQGLHINARHVFLHQTVEELAAYARSVSPRVEEREAAGAMTLLPIQRRFLSGDATAIGHYQQSRLLHVPDTFAAAFLTEWARAIYRRHDAFRQRFALGEAGWRADVLPFDEAMVAASVDVVPLRSGAAPDWELEVNQEASQVRDSVNFQEGPLFKIAYLHGREAARSRLFIVVHHLAVDGVSWRVLLDELDLGFRQWSAGKPIELGARGTSYQGWGAALERYAASDVLRAEKTYWLGEVRRPVTPLPTDRTIVSDVPRSVSRLRSLTWSVEETAALLTRCNGAYRTRIDELLLAALLIAFFRWTGHKAMRVAVEGHGREPGALARAGSDTDGEPDLDQTVGWFTTYYPLVLALDDMPDQDELVRAAIRSAKECCRAVPNRGLGYGVLRHLAGDGDLTRAEAEHPFEIVFNYLGQFDASSGLHAAFRLASERAGDDIALSRRREHRLGFNGEVRGGRLTFELDYSMADYVAATITGLVQLVEGSVREVIAHCADRPSTGFTPSDVPDARAQQAELDGWHRRYPALSDLYPATGLQIGMMFHSLRSPGKDPYVNQIVLEVDNDFDHAAFEASWATLIARHAILRTAIVGLERETPLQVVVDRAAPRWRALDRRGAEIDEAGVTLAACREEDRRAPFDFAEPCLMRFSTVRRPGGADIVWTYHHLLLDGWSLSLVWSELAKVYRARIRSQEPVLPAATPFATYVRWLAAQDPEKARAYWREELAGLHRPDSPQGRPGQSGPERYGCARLILDRERTRRLESAARAHRVTPFIVVQAAWAYLLHRRSGDREVIFGTTVSGRNADLPGISSIVGLLINTVPTRVRVDNARSIGGWLKDLHAVQVEREAHAHADLLQIQKAAALKPGQSLFDSVLIFENYAQDMDSIALPGMSGRKHDENTHYGLTLMVVPKANYVFDLQYDRDRYDDEGGGALIQDLNTIMENLMLDSDGSVVTLSSAASRTVDDGRRLSSVIRQGDLRLGRYLVHQLFEDHAAEMPSAAALVHGDTTYDYAGLNRAANRVADAVMARCPGLGPDAIVGLHLPRGDQLLIAILAVWKTGAAYVPVDPSLPRARVNAMLRSVEPVLIIRDVPDLSDDSLADWTGIAAPFADLLEAGRSDLNPDINVSGNDLAYVIFTSGSTGTPKGAMVEHIGMLNNIANKVVDFEVGAGSRVAQTASQSFDISVWQMFIALTRGGTTVIYDDRTINDVSGFVARLAADAVTLLEIVPTYLILVLEHLDDHPGAADMPALRHLVLTGETADAGSIRRWFRHCPSSLVVNAYGPTEASDDITHHVMDAKSDVLNPVPIGKALANFDIHVVDDALRPVPRGERGEIVATGVGVGRGYVGLPEPTAAAFLKTPFPDRYKGRLYRTGDVGEMREDGTLLFHGRKDKQVKVRGFRIELEEIELKLLELPSVRQAVVLDMTVPGRETFLCGFVVPNGNVDRAELKAALKDQLPPYMVPSEFRFLPRMPQLDNGKVDRKAVRAGYQGAQASFDHVPPGNELETRLAEIWSRVIGIERVGVLDDFFELGGDSFKAIRIAAQFGFPLEVADIYDHANIRALGEHIGRSASRSRKRLIVPVANVTPAARVAVLGISNSGGDPVSFVGVGKELARLGDEVALYAVKLPRKPAANAAAMVAEVELLTDEICNAIDRDLSLPLIVFAQCNGSALAISLAQRLHERATPPVAICIGGALLRTEPSRGDTRSSETIVEFLRSIGSTLPKTEAERSDFLISFRYDCDMADAYYDSVVGRMNRRALKRLGTPLWCVVGTEDPLVPHYRERYRDWDRLFSGVTLVEYSGHGHYLLRDCTRELALTLRDVWRQTLDARLDSGTRP